MTVMQIIFLVLGIILGVLLIGLIVLSIIGKRMQKKQAASQEQMEAASQVVSILVIDKKRMKLTESGLPKIVMESTPKYLRRSKVPVVKAKIGPKVMSLMCDDKIFPLLPVKKEIKAVISGIYIMDVKGRNVLETPKGKIGLWTKIKMKAAAQAQNK